MEMKRNKYNNKKTVIDGITFDSKREANRYAELIIKSDKGLVTNLTLQPRFELIPKFKDFDGKSVRKTEYVADFMYKQGDTTIVEDVKGVETQTFKIKWKMAMYKYPQYRFVIVK